MGGVGEAVAAVVFCLLGGVMNSTWPLFCKAESPKLIRVATDGGWQWENVWLPFTLWSCTLNIIMCMLVVSPSTLSAVYHDASVRDLSLVCVFSFLWGFGTMCFSLGIQLLGAGPGTALVMSLLVVIGTLLPLIEDHADDAASPAAVVTILGLVFAISGFVTSAKSSQIKTGAIAALQQQHAEANGDKHVKVNLVSANTKAAAASADTSEAGTIFASSVGTIMSDGMQANGTATAYAASGGGQDTRSAMHTNGASCGGEAKPSSALPRESHEETEGAKGGSSHVVAVAVCVAGAVMSSMLQFAFVYGEPLITRAEDEEGVSGVASPLVVWLLAFSLAGVWNVVYAGYLLWINNTWGRYAWMGWGDLCRKCFNLTVMSVFFVGHIHLYGVAQHLFGDLGPVIAWPLLMSSTVLSGQLWSILMKEWVGVPKVAVNVNIASISLLVTAVTVIAIAGAVL